MDEVKRCIITPEAVSGDEKVWSPSSKAEAKVTPIAWDDIEK